MDAREAALLLSYASGVDGREVGEAASRAWANIIDPTITLDQAFRYVDAHYGQSRWPIMPADINARPGELPKTFWDRKITND